MFADSTFRTQLRLSAVNSINWARIAAQIPYYVAAALALGTPGRPVTFAVPTGNFGNVLAAWAARRLGAPIGRLIVASNRNDILARFLAENDMSVRPVEPSLSPSMDIGVSSNFERILFEFLGRDPAADRRHHGEFPHAPAAWTCPKPPGHDARTLFEGFRLDDEGTTAEIRRLHDSERLPCRPPHRHRPRRRPGACPQAPARHRGGHRAPGQIPRRHASGHRLPRPPLPCAACPPI